MPSPQKARRIPSSATSPRPARPASYSRRRPQSTPLVKKQAGHAAFASEVPEDFTKTRVPLALEMTGHWVGPMPVNAFLDKFLPPAAEQLQELPENPFQSMFFQTSESNRYTPFIQAIQGWMPGFAAVNTSSKPDPDEKLKTDVSVYRASDRVPRCTQFSEMELWVEFKEKGSALPFQDPKKGSGDASSNEIPFLPNSKEAKSARGQLTSYAVAHHARQFRHFSFSILIHDEHARFLRWDHAGTVVTAAFNIREHPEFLASFLWRFAHCSPEERGYDTSVRPADLSPDVAQRVRTALTLEEDTPLFRYDLPGLPGHGYGPFPPFPSRSLVSRSTRNLPVFYIPVEPEEDEGVANDAAPDASSERKDVPPWRREGVVYLKDTWRFLSHDPNIKVMAEHEIYERLHKENTPYFPKHVAGGDIPGGMTQTQELLDAEWLSVKVTVTPFQHYRLVMDVVGRPLTKFKSTRELVQAIRDAMHAHCHAYIVVSILHRDISVGNILITDDGRGLLIDWEMGKLLSEAGARRYERTGTWQFMSAALLKDTHKMHTLSDDIESFIHVIGWLILRFIPSHEDFLPQSRAADMKMFDDADYYVEGKTLGGKAKASMLCSGKYPSFEFQFKQPTPLAYLLRTLCVPFRVLYSADPPTDADRAMLSELPNNPTDQEMLEMLRGINDYDRAMEQLKSSTWFINTIERALDNKRWPEDDGADDSVYTASTGLLTALQEQQRTSQLLNSQIQFASSRCSSNSSKRRAESPTPAPRPKRHRGASTSIPLTSSSITTS